MKRNYNNFYSKLSSAKIAYENEPSYQDWLMRQRAKRKELVAKGIVSFELMENIGYLMKVNGHTVVQLDDLRICNYMNHIKCKTVFDTVIAMMESK